MPPPEPVPTLSDVLKAISKMHDDVTIIIGIVKDVTTKLDAMAVKDVYVPCPGCNGTGTVEVSIDHPDGIGPDTELITCTRCAGVKYVKYGYESI